MKARGVMKAPAPPRYFESLSSSDKELYASMQQELYRIADRASKSRLSQIFDSIVSKIKSFVSRNESFEARSLVCGIVWMKDDIIALNTRQLSATMGRCKSSINTGFLTMGYETTPINPDHASYLSDIYPFMRYNFAESRQWTFRKKVSNCAAKKTENSSQKTLPVLLLESSHGELAEDEISIFRRPLEPSDISDDFIDPIDAPRFDKGLNPLWSLEFQTVAGSI